MKGQYITIIAASGLLTLSASCGTDKNKQNTDALSDVVNTLDAYNQDAGTDASKIPDIGPDTAPLADTSVEDTQTGQDVTEAADTLKDVAVTTPDSAAPEDAAECQSEKDCSPTPQCQKGTCTEGKCVWAPTPGESCDDGDKCTTGESCNPQGKCTGGAPLALKPLPCQVCSCDPKEGITCTGAKANSQCNDTLCCTSSDKCTACNPELDDPCPDWGMVCTGTPTTCDGTATCNEDTCKCSAAAVCGDGLLSGDEQCDDMNKINGDGCAKDCTIEPQCTDGCKSTADCPAGETCVGKAKSANDLQAKPIGQCEDTQTKLPGDGQKCGATLPCPEGLACLGEYQWKNDPGWCISGWMAKDFYSFDNKIIPDNGDALISKVIACGLATVPVDMVVTLHLDHPNPKDLVVTLENPYGDKGNVLKDQDYQGGKIPVSVGSGDTLVNGEWTLTIQDNVAGNAGKLLGWSLYLLSNFD